MHLKSFIHNLSFLILLIASTNSFCSNLKETSGFYGNGEAGLTNSTGNTTSTTLYGALALNYIQTANEVKSKLEFSYQSINNIQTQERYIINLQNNHFHYPDRRYYSFIKIKLEKSHFEGIELSTDLILGLGSILYKIVDTTLVGEAGVGKQTTEFTPDSGDHNSTQIIASFKLALEHTINDNTTLKQDLTVLTNSDATKSESNTAFKIKVAENMNLQATYKYRHNTNPASKSKKIDTQTSLTIAYDF